MREVSTQVEATEGNLMACRCQGARIVFAEGEEGNVKAQLCECIDIKPPIAHRNSESWEDDYEPLDREALEAYEASRIQIERLHKKAALISAAQIPNRYINALAADFYKPEIIEWKDDLIAGTSDERLLFFFGSTGTGKTQTAAFLTMHYLQAANDKSALYLPTYQLLENKRSSTAYSFDAKNLKDEAEYTFKETIKKAHAVDFLVLDELGQEKLTPMESKLIFELIDKRYSANKITILISNHCDNKELSLEGKRLSELVSARISSRLKSAKHFHFSGPDYRAQSQSETISREEVESFMVPAKILTHDEHEHQIMTWLTRNPAFEVVSTQKRQSLTDIVEGIEHDMDRPKASHYRDVPFVIMKIKSFTHC